MDSRAKRLRLTIAVALIVAVLLLIGVLCEYLYSKHYFTINYWWYLCRTRLLFWNELHFAFSSYGESESTTRLGVLFGLTGLLTWRCVSSGNITRGVGLSTVAMIAVSFAAPLCLRQARCPELLAVVTVQMMTIITCCVCLRWSEPLRFSLRDLFGLSLLSALYLVLPRFAQTIGSIIFLDRSFYSGGPINIFQLLLGFVAGLTAVAFLSKSKISPEFRPAYLVAVAFGACATGWCIAWMFESFKIMHSGRGNLDAVDFNQLSFWYGYAVLFPLSGFIAVTIVPMLTKLFQKTRFAKLPRFDNRLTTR